MRRKRNYAMMKLKFQKGWYYQMVELSLPVINESLGQNCLLILSCVELIGKELRQEVIDVDREVAKYLILLKKVAKNPLVRSLAKKGIEYAPGIYHKLTKRVKNKTLNRIFNSDAAHLALNKAIKTANNHLQ